jgi:hypothetical protein
MPGIFRNGLDVFVQGGFFKPFIGNADLAKAPDALGIDHMKGQLLIAQAEQNLYDGRAQHLIGTHAVGPDARLSAPEFTKVLKYALTHGRVTVNDAADRFELFGLGVIDFRGHQRHLLLPFFAHFAVGPFRFFVVILVAWLFPTYYIEPKKATTKCAFFIYYGYL